MNEKILAGRKGHAEGWNRVMGVCLVLPSNQKPLEGFQQSDSSAFPLEGHSGRCREHSLPGQRRQEAGQELRRALGWETVVLTGKSSDRARGQESSLYCVQERLLEC